MSRILIIEDEVSIAELEKDYLELSGFEVEIENDGDRGLQRRLTEMTSTRSGAWVWARTTISPSLSAPVRWWPG